VSDKYAFIDAEYAAASAPAIERMCRWLQVSKSGYYEWLHRPTSATAQRRELLKIKIKALFDASDGSYGYRRLHAALVAGGEQVGLELVRRLMRELDLIACQPRPWRSTTVQGGEPASAADLVDRDFTAEAPGSKLVGDITYIRTWAGWWYLATVIDCFNNQTSQQARQPESVKHLPERLSSSYRNRVLKLSTSYRNPMVKHEPELHRQGLPTNCPQPL
jgi:putative transposase